MYLILTISIICFIIWLATIKLWVKVGDKVSNKINEINITTKSNGENKGE